MIALTTEVWAVIATAVVVTLVILPALLVAHLVVRSLLAREANDCAVTEQARAAMRASPYLRLLNDDSATATVEAISKMRALKDEARTPVMSWKNIVVSWGRRVQTRAAIGRALSTER